MCGIFGIISASPWRKGDLVKLACFAQQRGRDSSGLLYLRDSTYRVDRADFEIGKLLERSRAHEHAYG